MIKKDSILLTKDPAGYLDHAPSLLSRTWLHNLVKQKLAESQTRFLLLTAEPGFGKTTLMAQLAAEQPAWLHYFAQSDGKYAERNVTARQFLMDIGFQLAKQQPTLMVQDNITLEVQQVIENIEVGSQVLGVTVGTLRTSPFYQQLVMKVDQNAHNISGELTEFHVDNLINDARLLPLADLQELALFGPAHRFEGQLVVLIDGLHEWLGDDSETDILHWLTNCPSGDIPHNVQFVLATRPPDERLQLLIRKQQAGLIHVCFDRNDGDGVQTEFQAHLDADVRFYAQGRVSEAQFRSYIAKMADEEAMWVERVVAKAEGNLGYVAELFQAANQQLAHNEPSGVQKLLALESVSPVLTERYKAFLGYIKKSTQYECIEVEDNKRCVTYQKAWSLLYRPLLELFAHMPYPLTFEQLHQQANIQVDADYTAIALNRLIPFLDHRNGFYKLYHHSFKEFLQESALT